MSIDFDSEKEYHRYIKANKLNEHNDVVSIDIGKCYSVCNVNISEPFVNCVFSLTGRGN